MKRLVLVFKILLGVIPFLPLFVDYIFKTNIRMSIMDMAMQWSLLIKVPILVMCISAYLYFWYVILKRSRKAYEKCKINQLFLQCNDNFYTTSSTKFNIMVGKLSLSYGNGTNEHSCWCEYGIFS